MLMRAPVRQGASNALTESSTDFRGDFHLHSTCSDGILSPADLIKLAAQGGVTVLSLTDHDSTEGIPAARAVCRDLGITLVPGAELSTDIENDEVHMLAHFLDPRDPALQKQLGSKREGRRERGESMVRKLNEAGLAISWERVQEIAGEASIGRPHVAQALLEGGYVQTIPEAFDRYIGRNGPAYSEREKLTPVESVKFIVDVGGIATFAHPQFTDSALDILPELVAAGLSGIEVYYKELDQDAAGYWLSVANQYDLIPMGGTDYHGLDNPGERLPGQQVTPLPRESVERLFARAEKLGRMDLVS